MEVLRKLLVDRCPEEKRLDYKYAPDPETGNDPELTLIFQKRVPIDYEGVSTDMIAERVLLAKARGEAVPEINGYEHYDPRFLPKWEDYKIKLIEKYDKLFVTWPEDVQKKVQTATTKKTQLPSMATGVAGNHDQITDFRGRLRCMRRLQLQLRQGQLPWCAWWR